MHKYYIRYRHTNSMAPYRAPIPCRVLRIVEAEFLLHALVVVGRKPVVSERDWKLLVIEPVMPRDDLRMFCSLWTSTTYRPAVATVRPRLASSSYQQNQTQPRIQTVRRSTI